VASYESYTRVTIYTSKAEKRIATTDGYAERCGPVLEGNERLL
jgi:hypothetical protein